MSSSDHGLTHEICAAGVNIAVDFKFDKFQELASTLPVGESVSVPLVQFEPYKFALTLYPNGRVEDCRGWLSLFISRDDSTESDLTFSGSAEVLPCDWLSAPGDRCLRSWDSEKLPAKKHSGVDRFANHESLRRGGFLSDGVLRLRVRFTPELVGLPSITPPQKPAPTELLARDMGNLLDSPTTSDVTLLTEGREFSLHWSVLTARSPVFQRMLQSKMSEAERQRVEIRDVDASAMFHFIRFLYTATFPSVDEYITSPVGSWRYAYGCYEVKSEEGSLVWSEYSRSKGFQQGNLEQVDTMKWSTKLSNDGTLALSLKDENEISV